MFYTFTAHEAKLITDCFNEGAACANGFGATPCCTPFTCVPVGGVPIPNVGGSCRKGKDSYQSLFATKTRDLAQPFVRDWERNIACLFSPPVVGI